MLTDKGDPLLAHWQFGLGRSVAFTSDAKAKWAQDWLGWEKYRQFWSQIAKWSLRRLDNADLTTDVTVDKGEGVISVEALDEKGNYRNFLNLQAAVVSPKGEKHSDEKRNEHAPDEQLFPHQGPFLDWIGDIFLPNPLPQGGKGRGRGISWAGRAQRLCRS